MIDASGLRIGNNSSYTLDDFYAVYPQFGKNTAGTYVVSEVIVQMYLDFANACIQEARWHSAWKSAMGWFVAHFCTLYLQGLEDPDSGAAAVIKAGQTRGLDTSVSVGGVSVSTDYSLALNGLSGWVNWSLTIYGQQIIQIGRLVGMGAMLVN